MAEIRVNGKIVNLGMYEDEEKAARRFDEVAAKHGRDLNFTARRVSSALSDAKDGPASGEALPGEYLVDPAGTWNDASSTQSKVKKRGAVSSSSNNAGGDSGGGSSKTVKRARPWKTQAEHAPPSAKDQSAAAAASSGFPGATFGALFGAAQHCLL